MPRYSHITIACKAAQSWAVIELYRAVCARRRHGNPDIINIINIVDIAITIAINISSTVFIEGVAVITTNVLSIWNK